MWKCLHGLEGFAPLGRRVGEALTWLRGPMPNDWVAKQQTASISRFSGWKYEAHGYSWKLLWYSTENSLLSMISLPGVSVQTC